MKKPYTLYKRGKVWHYKLAGDSHYRTTGKRTKAEAEKFCIRLLNGDNRQTIDAAKTLADITQDMFVRGKCSWINRKEKRGKHVSPEMERLRRGQLVNHILPQFGKRIPASITQNEIDDWLTDLELSPRTKNHMLDTLRIVWKELVNGGYITTNVVENIERFAKTQKNRDIFSKAELEKLFPDSIDEATRIWGDIRIAAMHAVMAATGIRLGEVRALEWQDLVLSKDGNPYLSITKAVKNVALRIGDTKNGKNRAVPLNHTAFRYLQAWHDQSPFTGPSALMFPNTKGKPLQGRYVWEKFRKALEAAEIACEGRNLVPHSFRHTFNTLFRRSLDDRTLQLLTGHTTDSMTDNYDHPDTASMIAAIEEYSQTITEVWTRETEQTPGGQAADMATEAMFRTTTEDNEGEVPA